MPRSDFNYAQTVLGSCGHVCDGWPVITKLGGGDPWVPCDECTHAQYVIPGDERIGVWVRVADLPKSVQKKIAPKKAVKKKAPVKKVQPWDVFLAGD